MVKSMKNWKKLMAGFCAAAMVSSMVVPVWATEDAAEEEELVLEEAEEELLERLEEELPPEVQPLKARSIAMAQATASVFFTFMIGPP